MAKPRDLPENWRDEWRKAGPAYDRESWRDIAREVLRFGWWWQSRIALGGIALLALFVIIGVIVVAVAS